jgi:PQQ-dependent dehydrogenase (methanol/ethanol family)
MRTRGRCRWLTAVASAAVAVLSAYVHGQDAEPAGAALYGRHCAGCHGAEGAGGDRGPALVNNRAMRGRPDTYFLNIIRTGTPGGMPPFALPENQLNSLAVWLHSLNASASEAAPSGDAAAGGQFFFGKGQCAMCHMVRGNGRPNGPDLSDIGARATLLEIQQALDDPKARSNSRSAPGCPSWAFCPDHSWSRVIVTLRDGSTVRGYARNRGQHDIQLQTLDGAWRFLLDTEYKAVQADPTPAMPKLVVSEVERRDLLAFLSGLDGVKSGPSVVASDPPSRDDIARILTPHRGEWPTYNGDVRGNRYSVLAQINAQNVSMLRVAWTYALPFNALETTPLVIDGVMYVTGSTAVCALDARVGRQLWCYTRDAAGADDGSRPGDGRAIGGPGGVAGFAAFGTGTQRGVAVLGDRVFFTTIDAHMVALNRFTGGVLWDVPMTADGVTGRYSGPAAPLVVGDLVVSGIAGGDSPLRGFLAAFEPATGRLAWRFWTVPARREALSGTWNGTALETGGAATWLTGSYDPETGMLYWTTGNPFPPTDGRQRGGDNLYSNSVLALDGKTGRLKWHYQFTPHDLHDWDATEPVLLVDASFRPPVRSGRKLLLQANRSGFFYVLDRTNGELVLAKPFVKKMTWAKEIGADGRPVLLEGGTPSAAGTKTCPQVRGATNWYSTAFSPATNLFYVMAVEDCSIYRQSRGYVPYLDPADPPRKFLRAINIDSGAVAWESEETGAPEANYSGVLATAGGLVFHGETSGSFNAADAKTGRSLWHFNANQAWKASPMTYAIGDTQFVGIAAGSGAIFSFSLNSGKSDR